MDNSEQRRSKHRKRLAKIFGAVLKRVRARAGRSQEEVAFLTGIDRGHISDLETGRVAPSLLYVFELAYALGEAPNVLVSELEAKIGPWLPSPELVESLAVKKQRRPRDTNLPGIDPTP